MAEMIETTCQLSGSPFLEATFLPVVLKRHQKSNTEAILWAALPPQKHLGPPVVPFELFFGCEGSPTKKDYRNKQKTTENKSGTLILTSPLEDPKN